MGFKNEIVLAKRTATFQSRVLVMFHQLIDKISEYVNLVVETSSTLKYLAIHELTLLFRSEFPPTKPQALFADRGNSFFVEGLS